MLATTKTMMDMVTMMLAGRKTMMVRMMLTKTMVRMMLTKTMVTMMLRKTIVVKPK